MHLVRRSWYRRLATGLAVSALGGALLAAGALAQQAPPAAAPVAEPAEVTALRLQFAGMTRAEAAAAGYEAEGHCVSAAEAGAPPGLGNMGDHAINRAAYESQFRSGPVASAPPILLLDGNGLVVGVEWEANQSLPAPVLFGITVPVQPGHPGTPDPHYMLHVFFHPAGTALFGPPNPPFDAELSCTPAPPAGDGLSLAGESPETRALFVRTWGVQAASRWVQEHNAERLAGR